MQLTPLSDQVLVVTGASSGIGLATARLAIEGGARVVLAARDETALATLCDTLGDRASFVVCDVGVEADVERLATTVRERHGRVDTWVNVAGVGIIAPLADTTIADHRRLFETNYWGVVYGSMAAVRLFREQGTAGAIINVGSSFSDLAPPTMGAYAASKFAVKAFSNSLRVELRQEGLPVSVTLIKPSVIDSKFYDNAETPLDTAAWIPPPRYAPSVVAEAILDAAVHARREIAVGLPAVMAGTMGVVMPALMERMMDPMRESLWRDAGAPKPLASGVHAVPVEGQERSGRASARTFSLTAWAQRNPWTLVGAASLAGLLLGRRVVKR